LVALDQLVAATRQLRGAEALGLADVDPRAPAGFLPCAADAHDDTAEIETHDARDARAHACSSVAGGALSSSDPSAPVFITSCMTTVAKEPGGSSKAQRT